jgi:uncharacterized protein (DUF952 family)
MPSLIPRADAYVFHLARSADYDAARTLGFYRGSAEDAVDGYMHFSTAAQVRVSAARHRAGEAGLLLIAVDPAALGAAFKWEAARGGDLFPHLYGDLPLAAVAKAEPLALGPDGLHQFPDWVVAPETAAAAAVDPGA